MSASSSERSIGIAPVEGTNARVLVLGSMPGRVSLAAQEYYAHPRNAFWDVVEELGIAPRGHEYGARCDALRRRGIALWDVVRSCLRAGSLDAHIRDVEVNALAAFRGRHPELGWMLFNGRKARELFDRHGGPAPAGVELLTLPSTSPANTQRGKRERWIEVLGRALADAGPPPR